MRTRGFTLLEVMGIVPIIALLVGVGQGLALKPGDKANQVTCLSHLQQLGVAFQMYRQDWGDTLPTWYNPTPAPLPEPFNNGSSTWTWDVAISPYVGHLNTFTCPSKAPWPANVYLPIRSYAFPRNVSGMPYSAARLPEKTVLLFEKGVQPVGAYADATGTWFAQTSDGASVPMLQYPTLPTKWGMHHDAGNNFLFLDGHVLWVQQMLFRTASTTNPYGYSFGNSPEQGIFQYGYCGDKANNTSGPEWGANIPH